MKYLKVILATSTLIIAGNAIAEGKTILTERLISSPPAHRAFVVRDYAGVSTTNACSDMVLRGTYDMEADISDTSYKDDSDTLIFRAGAQATCYKRTFTMSRTGNFYTTENVRLTWDDISQSYTAAAPTTAAVDVSKG